MLKNGWLILGLALCLAGSANAATLSVSTDKSSYEVGETIIVTVDLSAGGESGMFAFVELAFDTALVGDPFFDIEPATLSFFGGGLPWIVGALQATCPQPDRCRVVDQIGGLNPFQVDPYASSAVIGFVAQNPGIAEFSTPAADFLGAPPASTSVTITAATGPALSATKADALQVDVGGDGSADPGDTLRYTVVVGNPGVSDLTGVVFSDSPDANTELIVGSVTTTQGAVTIGNTAGDIDAEVDVGTLAPGSNAVVTFDVVIDSPLPMGVTLISNQGVVISIELADRMTDDPDTPTVDDATNTTLGVPDPGGDGPSQAEFDALAARVGALEASDSSQDSRLDGQATQLSDQATKLTGLMDDVAQLQSDLAALTARVAALEAAGTTQAGDIAALEAALAELTARLELVEGLPGIEQRLQKLEAQAP